MPGSTFVVPCGTVIAAIGEVPDVSYLPCEIEKTADGHIAIDPRTYRTSIDRLYAVGEMTGVKGTVTALRAGLECGDALDQVLHRSRQGRGEVQA
ncbi:MAG: hypothetical protein ACREFQ_04385 [Stellaceae bacterium]